MAIIEFESVTYKNFLATGNNPNTIYLNKSKTTLIVGKNGVGKTTMAEAICFSLFGKPYRDIKLGQLVNSINGKHCEVTVNFRIGDKTYKVLRGLKPNKLEIYENGILLNQDASSRDYQKVLEQQILRLNYKTFTQLVILGATSFVPFMQLKSAQRREVVEDILDINIFSTMNVLLKDKITSSKSAIVTLDNKINLLKTKIQSQKNIIAVKSKAKEDSIHSLQKKICDNNDSIEFASKQIDILSESIQIDLEYIKNFNVHKQTHLSLNDMIASNNTAISTKDKNLKFFQTHDTCPTCTQVIDVDHKTSCIKNLEDDITENEGILTKLQQARDEIKQILEEYESIQSKITDQNIRLSTTNATIVELNKSNKKYLDEINEIENANQDVDNEKILLKQYASEVIEAIETKNTLMEERQIQDICIQLLKDTGIKTAIIKEYLPVMNTMINYYLDIMDTFIKFELDESFNETIKSRHRDDFTYDSFSEGEKKRIDIAILFAWRYIAKLKNSVNTNLLIMDEVMDSSVDDDGLEYLFQILAEVSKETNIFVISHRGEILYDRFDSILKVEKKNNFSVIV